MYRLLFQNRAGPTEPMVIDLPALVIGRRDDCHVQIVEPGVSDHHATIERHPDGYYVRRLDSGGLVSVNGEVVTARRLSSRDELEIGPAHIRFEIVHGVAGGRYRRPVDRLQITATAVVAAVIVGQVALLGSMFSEYRPNKVKLDTARTAQLDQVGTASAGSSAPSTAASERPRSTGGTTAGTQPQAEPLVLNRMIRLVHVDRSDNGENVSVTIQAKAQVGERELDPSAVAICVQYAVVDGAGMGVDWLKPIWLPIPSWENFSSKTLSARFPGTGRELVGIVVRTYYHRQMQDVWGVPQSLRPLAPIPVAGGPP
jgi:pSer/pThr/pTyr-binding forkhead associated (FHA) protein